MYYNSQRPPNIQVNHWIPTANNQRIERICAKFSNGIRQINKHLYEYLLPKMSNTNTPKFYGIPKVHKKFTNIPPVRPIIAQTTSPLAPSARLIDHVLQPLAQSYSDYLHNSTVLIKTLQDMSIPEEAVLVTIDVTNLYPSTVEPPIMDTPTSGQPPTKGQTPCPLPTTACTPYIPNLRRRDTSDLQIMDKSHAPQLSLCIHYNLQ